MRIIAGKLGGLGFESPRGHKTHPMSEKARGALFNTLGDIHGLTILDAFAGSGAVSFEAISRGADAALAIEIDHTAHAVIVRNIAALKLEDQTKAIRSNVVAWSNRHPDEQFDLVVCDPPYNDIQYKVLRKLVRHIKVGGVMIISLPKDHIELALEGLELIQSKEYGDAMLVFYRRIS